MNENWHQQTCEHCIFLVSDKCRRFPPQGTNGYPIVTKQSILDDSIVYSKACAELNIRVDN